MFKGPKKENMAFKIKEHPLFRNERKDRRKCGPEFYEAWH